jgi:DNA-binding transcriptional ArsR family regulator
LPTEPLDSIEADEPTDADERRLDEIFDALAHPHRREIVRVLGLQPVAISQLARRRGLSLPAINKHIGILERTGLVDRRKIGRTTYLTLRRRPLGLLQSWVEQFHPYWGHDDASYENYFDHLTRSGERPPASGPDTTMKETPP